MCLCSSSIESKPAAMYRWSRLATTCNGKRYLILSGHYFKSEANWNNYYLSTSRSTMTVKDAKEHPIVFFCQQERRRMSIFNRKVWPEWAHVIRCDWTIPRDRSRGELIPVENCCDILRSKSRSVLSWNGRLTKASNWRHTWLRRYKTADMMIGIDTFARNLKSEWVLRNIW